MLKLWKFLSGIVAENQKNSSRIGLTMQRAHLQRSQEDSITEREEWIELNTQAKDKRKKIPMKF